MSERLVSARDALDAVSTSPRTQLILRALIAAVQAILAQLLEERVSSRKDKV